MAELDRLYAGIGNDLAFENMPDAVAKMCGARSAMITRIDSKGALSYSRMSYFDADTAARYYSEGWIDDDPWANAANLIPGRANVADTILPPEKFHKTAMYNELFRSSGDDTARCVGLISASPHEIIVLGIHRPGKARAFTIENAALLDNALIHIRRVFHSRDVITCSQAESRLSTALLNKTAAAMVVVDSALRVYQMTERAKALIERADGIRYVMGRLALEDAGAHHSLAAAVRGAVNQKAEAPSALLCPRLSTPLSYRFVALPAGSDAPNCAIVMIDDPAAGRDEGHLRRFAQAYGLTSAETALAKGLAEDQCLDEIAVKRGVTKETVRTQLKSLFLKTGSRRQIDLIKLIVQMP